MCSQQTLPRNEKIMMWFWPSQPVTVSLFGAHINDGCSMRSSNPIADSKSDNIGHPFTNTAQNSSAKFDLFHDNFNFKIKNSEFQKL